MNANRLKAQMVLNRCSIDKLAGALGLNPMTVRYKIKQDGFKVCEARAIGKLLNLSSKEMCEIFFAND